VPLARAQGFPSRALARFARAAYFRRGICSKAPEHDADHRKTDERDNRCGITFEVANQPAVATAEIESFDPRSQARGQ
jgi:hypothetical protein